MTVEPEQFRSCDALVVGGGIAGLVAAWRLCQQGLRPLLVEARGYFGGMVAQSTFGGVRIDIGAEDFTARTECMPDLLASLGLEASADSHGSSKLFLPELSQTDARKWKLYPFPARSFLGIPAHPEDPDVHAIIGEEGVARAKEDRVLGEETGTSEESIDIASFVSARMGERVTERLLRPIIGGIYSCAPTDLDTDTTIPALRELTRKTGALSSAVEKMREGAQKREGAAKSLSQSIEGGLYRLVDALAQAISTHGGTLCSRVGAQHLGFVNNRWHVQLSRTEPADQPNLEPIPVGENWVCETPRLVLASSASAALRLIGDVAQARGYQIDSQLEIPLGARIRRYFLRIADKNIHDLKHLGQGALVDSFAQSCPVRCKAISYLNVKWPWLTEHLQEDEHMFRLSYEADEEIDLKQQLADLRELTGLKISETSVQEILPIQWSGGLKPATPHYRAQIRTLERELFVCDGLAVTGAWIAGNGIENVVGHASRRARELTATGRLADRLTDRSVSVSTDSAERSKPFASRELILGTRGSQLALTQSRHVARMIEEASAKCGTPVSVRIRVISSQGDEDGKSLRNFAGIGVFAASLRTALLKGECDIAVHSLKDLPTQAVEGLRIVAIPEREDVRDALCARDGLPLAQLPAGARVGTGSPRRAAQLLRLRPDIVPVDIRGNVPTRLSRVKGVELAADRGTARHTLGAPHPADDLGRNREELDAVVLAYAGLKRLGLEQHTTEVFETDQMLPAAAQGALAVEARTHMHEFLQKIFQKVHNLQAATEVLVEREVMRTLGAGCAAPVGVCARVNETQDEKFQLLIQGIVLDESARSIVQASSCNFYSDYDDHRALASAGASLAHELVEKGAADIVSLSKNHTDCGLRSHA